MARRLHPAYLIASAFFVIVLIFFYRRSSTSVIIVPPQSAINLLPLPSVPCSKEFSEKWELAKKILLIDSELNLIDVGIECGDMALAAAQFGRHVLAVEGDMKRISSLESMKNAQGVSSFIKIVDSSIFQRESVLDIERVITASLFRRAIIKLPRFSPTDTTILEAIVDQMDIFSVLLVDVKNCEALNEFIQTKGYNGVNALFKPIQSPCQSSIPVWVKKPVIAPKPEKPLVIVDTAKVPSLMNYLKCIPMPSANMNHICHSTLDKFIAPSLGSVGWEYYVWKPMKEILDSDPSLGLIDIGANIGVFTINVAAMGRPVLAIEAFYENIQRLSEALRINDKISKHVTLVNNAVSDRHETMYFWTPLDNPGGTHVFSEEVLKQRNDLYHGKHSTIESVLLNELVSLAPKKAVFKIDIEGGELKALKQFEEMLTKVDIVAIFMEWTSIPTSPDCLNIVQLFRKYGYSPYGITRTTKPLKDLPKLSGETLEEVRKWTNDIVWRRQSSYTPFNS